MSQKNKINIGIIGTGMIGTSIAVLTTGHGYTTTVYAVNDELASISRRQLDRYYADLVAQGLMSDEQVAVCTRYLRYTCDYRDLADAELIFECVVEKLEVKHAVYRELEQYCPSLKAICSVSSAIVVDDLSAGTGKYQDRIIVAHPFNPPHLVPFFEIAKGKDTADGVTDFAKAVLENLDRKVVVLKKGAPGFIGNRLQMALWREAQYIVESGIADARDVDTAAMYSFMPRYTSIGIFEHFDNGGLDLSFNVNKYLFPSLCNATENLKSMSDKVANGDLGVKTGKGFYDWTNVDLNAFRARVSAPFWHFFNWDIPKE